MNKKYIVRQSDEERKVCEQAIKDQKASRRSCGVLRCY